jgi:predicted transposase/invertase (TIGR01784 family)
MILLSKEYLDLKIDFMFKQLFGQTRRKHITIALLNDLLGRTNEDRDRIIDLTFENTEIIQERKEGKSVRLDLTVITTSDERINVEIQIINNHDMPERILYYWAKSYSNIIHSGDTYQMLKPSIMISILNYPLFPSETDRFHTIFHIREDEGHFLWSNHLEFHVFDLRTFMVQWKKYRRQMKRMENKEWPWLMMLSVADYRKEKLDKELFNELEEWAMNEEKVREALIEWETLSANKENRALYEARTKELRDTLSNLEGERRLGKDEGRIEGRIEGKIEEKQTIAQKMMDEGIEISIVAKITGMSTEEIKKLTGFM